MVLPATEGVGNAGNWVADNPLTTGGAITGGAIGGPVGAVGGAYVGGMLDSSGRTSDHDAFMANSGIADPGLFQSYQSSPGMQQGNTTGLEGITDFTKRGAGEVAAGNVQGWQPTKAPGAWDAAQGYFKGQSHTEQYVSRAAGQTPDVRNASNYAEQAYTGLDRQNTTPADMSAYYERAKERAAQDINRQAVARGTFSSSRAQDQIGDAFANIEAERALREANYGIERSADERAWAGLGGELASLADASGRAAMGADLDWILGRAELYGAADTTKRQRINDHLKTALGMDTQDFNVLLGKMGAGTIEQELGQGRSNQLLNNVMGFSGAANDILGSGYNNMLMNDQDLFQRALEWGTGTAALGRDQSAIDKQDLANDLAMFYQIGKDQGWIKSGG